MFLTRLIALFLIMVFPAVGLAGDYRCAEKIISIGDSRAKLLSRCGKADWRQTYEEEIVEAFDEDTQFKTTVTVEEWTYNLGPSRFMRIFKLRNGKVVNIRSGRYGYDRDPAAGAKCSDQIISKGDSSADLLMKCGEPAYKDKRKEVLRSELSGDVVRKETVTVEEWTYDSGPSRFIRVFTLRNGRVTDIRSEDYGE